MPAIPYTAHSIYAFFVFNVEICAQKLSQAKINEWVKEKTGGKIPQLLGQPLDRSTLVFLVNAVYFKAKWAQPFQAENTYSGTFHLTNEESVKCDMMMLTENTDEIRFGNSDELDSQLLELPYEGKIC